MKIKEADEGDFVRLKEGGSKMQIVDIESERIVCRWLVGDNQVKTWGFPPEDLCLVRKGDGSILPEFL